MTLPPTGRTRRTAPVNSGEMGWCVTLHYERRLGEGRHRDAQAQHWTGWLAAHRLAAGLAELDAGGHSKLNTAFHKQGIGHDVADIERGDRNRERQLKQSSTTRRCLICRAQQKMRRAGLNIRPPEGSITTGGLSTDTGEDNDRSTRGDRGPGVRPPVHEHPRARVRGVESAA